MNLKQLAKELNLSISTVSKALRDSYEISHATKQLVLAKAKELNYQANPFASNLRKQKSKTIALVVPEIANNFFSQAINGIEAIAQDKGYHVLIYLTHEDAQKEKAIVNILQNGRVDGIIMSLSHQTKDVSHLQMLHNQHIPLVFFDRAADNIKVPKITTNDFQSSYDATQLLLQKGCKSIAFLSFSDHISIIQQRMQGFLSAMQTTKCSSYTNWIVPCGIDNALNYTIVKQLLQQSHRPDGIVASVERLAITTYEVCNQLQLHIPKQVKIIGYTNLQTAFLLQPSLSAITQPAYEMGCEAASILFRLIEQKGVAFIAQETILNSVIVERNSTVSEY